MRVSTFGSSLLLGVSSIAAATIATPALADAPANDPAAFSWTGPYIGASIGRAAADSTWTSTGSFGGADSEKLHHAGTTYGGQIGYNYQLPHSSFVVGLEVSLHGTSQKAAKTYTGGEGYTGATAIGLSSKFGGDVSVRAGVGVEQLLVFGKLGYGFQKFDYTASTETSTGGGNFTTANYAWSKTRGGVLVGAGLEYAINRHWSVKGEYNHQFFSKQTYALDSALSPMIDETSDNFKFGVNFRF